MKTSFSDFFQGRGAAKVASRETGIPYTTIRQHVVGLRKISMSSAVRYHKMMGIPYELMTPEKQLREQAQA